MSNEVKYDFNVSVSYYEGMNSLYTGTVVEKFSVFKDEFLERLAKLITTVVLPYNIIKSNKVYNVSIGAYTVYESEFNDSDEYESYVASLLGKYKLDTLFAGNSRVFVSYVNRETEKGIKVYVKPSVVGSEELYTKTRGFELVSKYAGSEFLLPTRSTIGSAGYDLRSAEVVTIQPKEIKLIPLGVKVYMQPNEVLYLYDRSSNPRKKGLVTVNSVGIIDSDYYNNPDNEGLVYAQMMNITDEPVTVDLGERLCQGVFMNYLVADTGNTTGKRVGGFGSTGR